MAVTVPNQWAGTFAAPAVFGVMAPALQSTVIALTPATSVGGGSGTPTAGNWLVCLAGWNQAGLPAATIAANDDIHSFWRPGQVITASWPGNVPSGIPAVSPAAGSTRAAAWYTPNLARVPGDVYAAPDSAMNGMAVLVIELAGMGPWDTITGISVNYAAAATSLSLSLGAPGAQAVIIGAVCGDSTAAGQAFAPGGWTPLSTVQASSGSSHANDAVLTSAWITTSGSVSVTGTATSAADLSGVLIGILVNGGSPVAAGSNPNWPSPLKFEAALGAGYQTPPDQLIWTDLSNRIWSWDETTGIQYEFGEVQSTDLQLELDNFDQNLSSDWPGALYYSNALNRNMSFQSGIAPWAAWGSSALAQSSAFAYASSPGATATYSLRVTPNGTTANPGATSEFVPVSGNTAYTVSGWVRSSAAWASGWQCSLIWYDSTKTFISFASGSTPLATSGTWQQVSDTVTSPANAAYAVLLFQAAGTPPAATVFYLAECAVVPGSSPVATGLITAGTPVRLRGALGTIGGQTVNRWYVIQRNAAEWPQQIMDVRRQYVPATGSDIWSATSAICPTAYRGEIYQDVAPGGAWWWPCDDQPLAGGVLPVTLRNAAPGSATALQITTGSGTVSPQDQYSASGTDLTSLSVGAVAQPVPQGMPLYQVAANAGWMPGDPQSSGSTLSASGGPVTASPGAASWQQTGVAGNTGAGAWFLTANDTYPALNTGVTVEAWFLAGFAATATGYTQGTTKVSIGGQPPGTFLSLLELATASASVAILQLDSSGHLVFGGHTVYTSSDLRCGSWFHVAVVFTAANTVLYLNGGITAIASSLGSYGPSWNWLILGADLGASGGSTLSAAVHSGNLSVSHAAVYPQALPLARILARYTAAVCGFGMLPAPTQPQITQVAQKNPGVQYLPDGTEFQGIYGTTPGGGGGTASVTYSFSAVAVNRAGTITSGPSPRAAIAGTGSGVNFAAIGQAVWTGWTSVSPLTDIYTASAEGSETHAAACLGSGDSFISGYGSGASGHGVCQVSAGTGASPPSSASVIGDTVAQRIERILGYGAVTYPGRCIDASASQPVQSAFDIGGQSAGTNLQNIAQSDAGLLYIDNLGNITYWSRTHLASQYASPVWTIGPALIPYYRDIDWKADPHRVWNAITITPYSPTGQSLPLVTPRSVAAVTASQDQYGAQPYQQVNYLQSGTEQQNLADWILANFGTLRIRTDSVRVDAASHPAAWPLVLGGNVADVAAVQNWQVGAGGITGTFRVTQIKRKFIFGGQTGDTSAEIDLTCDFEPSSYPA